MWAPGRNPETRAAWLRVEGQMDLRPCDGCDRCRIRCAEGIQMTRGEFEAVIDAAGRVDPARREAVLAQDKTVDLGDGVEVRMCRYLDMVGGGCLVYKARPLVCRLLGHVEWMPCPIEKVDRVVPTADALPLMRAYATEERLTFDQWEERIGRE